MPFRLRSGKRTGRYDLSKDLYVVTVQLLDNNSLQCTLATESTGKECVEYLCQRLELHQNMYFGLKYKSMRMMYRWVDLSKPLRKQLDKFAQDFRLYFGVMFHTFSVLSLTDDVARYYYFLQMRADILDGRLLVSPEKAILLASYSLQFDLGDHDETKHTVDALQNYVLLPRHMTQSVQILEDLIRQALLGHKNLRGLSQSQAELRYIAEAQQCEGYGEEYFAGKDEDGNDVFIGYCMEGLIVKRLQGPPLKYRWEEICNIHASKRNFIVSCTESTHIYFQMEDAEAAKYAAMLFTLQCMFFCRYCPKDYGKKEAYALQKELCSLPNEWPNPCYVAPCKNSMEFRTTQQDGITRTDGEGGFFHRQQSVGVIDTSENSAANALGSTKMLCCPNISYAAKHLSKSQPLISSGFAMPLTSNQAALNSAGAAVNGDLRYAAGGPEALPVSSDAVPPYRRAPDYETALKQPSLEEYKLSLWRAYQNERQKRAGTPGPFDLTDSYQGTMISDQMAFGGHRLLSAQPSVVSQPPATVMATRARCTCATSNPEVNRVAMQPTSGHQEDSSRLYEKQQHRTTLFPAATQHAFASTPDLSKSVLKSLSFPDVVSRCNNDPLSMDALTPLELTLRSLAIDRGETAMATEAKRLSSYLAAVNEEIRQSRELLVSTSRGDVSSLRPPSQKDAVNGALEERSPSAAEPLSTGQSQTIPYDGSGFSSSNRSQPFSVQTVLKPKPDVVPTGDAECSLRIMEEEMLETQNVIRLEFDNIPKRRMSAGFQTAQRPENERRNRYKHILPYEDTRFVLRSTKTNAFGYINASNVLVKFGKHSLRYIAGQAPTRNTAVDFWQMVWESGCYIIVMLTSCVENGVDLCYRYWPRTSTEGKVIRFGDYAVTLSNYVETSVHMFSSLRLKYLPTNQQRLIYHFQYVEWPRGGVPRSLTSFLGFLDEVSGMRRHVENQSALMGLGSSAFPYYEVAASSDYRSELGRHISEVSPPVLVHCHSGVGRTGVYILADIMIYSVEHNLDFDLPSVLAMLRQQRMNMVDTYEQYLFVYQCLEEHVRHSRLV